MSKIDLQEVGLANGTTFVPTTNANYAEIETKSDTFLSRVGTAPNYMEAALDMNSNRILNLPEPVSGLEPMRLQDHTALTGGSITFNSTSPYVSVKDYDAVGDGVADDSAAINAAILGADNDGVGIVFVPAGTYRIAATPVFMRPDITLMGEGALSIIKQANSVNLDAVIDFSGYLGGVVATGGALRNLTVDGNRANNSGGLFLNETKKIVYYGNTDYITIADCIIQNGPGYGVAGSGQTGFKFLNNKVSNTEDYNLFMVEFAGGVVGNCIVHGNLFDNQVLFEGIDHVTFTSNQIYSDITIGQFDTPLRVNISGTAVTWVSGPNFSTCKSGGVLIGKLGTVQVPVKTVNSSTSITLTASGGTETNILAMIGNNDLFGCGGGKGCVVANNKVHGGASYGFSLGGGPNTPMEQCLYANNYVTGQGKGGIVFLGDAGGFAGVGGKNNSFIGNMVVNVCLGGAATCQPNDFDRHSFILQPNGTTFENFLLDNNFCLDENGQTYTWLNTYGTSDGDVTIGPGNFQSGAVHPGYFQLALKNYQWDIPVPTGDYEKINGPSCNVTRGFSGSVAYWQANDGYMEFGTSGNFDTSFRTNSTVRMKIAGDGQTTVRSDIATPAAGSTSARLLFGTTAGFGIYYGSGAPTVSAAQGSLYLRSDGAQNARLYINSNGTTGWATFNTIT